MSLRPLVISLVLLFACASLVEGQLRPLRVSGTRNLAFGALFPGVAGTVAPTDPVRSAQYDVVGGNRSEVAFTFTLPSVMNGPGGATLPLSFGPTSAGYSTTGAIASQTPVDPNVTFTLRLSNNGRAYIYLGGTATPTSTQPAGAYAATVTLTAAYTGL